MPTLIRTPMSYFVSYAHHDASLVDPLLEELDVQMKPSQRFNHSLWLDQDRIIVGRLWKQRISEALRECDYGLLLLSPAFFGSPFVTTVELPRFVGGRKPCIPVLLAPVNIGLIDTKGLDAYQFFALATQNTRHTKSFDECKGREKRLYCEQLFAKIEARIEADRCGVTV